jgi:thioredoxin 1
MLHTNLNHIESKTDFKQVLEQNENVMICCGRMGPMCIPVYAAMTELKNQHPNIYFADFEFDHPDAHLIHNAPETNGFMGLPFTMYYKNGKVVKATSSIQRKEQIEAILNEHFNN